MSDFKNAVRALRKSLGFSIVAILTIAVGIGANTALFSVYDRLVLNPVTIARPSSLVAIWTTNPQLNLNAPAISWPRYEEIRSQAQSFASVGISAFDNFTLTGNGDPEQLNGQRVSATFFPTLGILPAAGRNFTADEDLPNGPAVCIISHELWQARFGGRAALIGETITLNGQPWQVVGVTPPRLTAPFAQVQVFAPRVFEVGGLTPMQVQNGSGYAQPIARLRPGVSLQQAANELAAISRGSKERFATRLDANNTSVPLMFVPSLVGNLEPTFYTLIGAVSFVLLIACANVASLFLGRLTARRKEIAVRQSLGATRARVVKQFLIESLVFSIVAGALGLLLALWALSAIQSIVASQLPPNTVLTLNWRALLFTGNVTLVTALLVGLAPALQASRAHLVEVLKDGPRGSSGERGRRFRATLIVAEVALSVVLLIGSSLLLVSFLQLQRTTPGFEAKGAAAAFVGVPAARYPTPAQQAQFFVQVIERLRAHPGVADAAVAIGLPLSGFNPRFPYGVGGRPILPLPQRPLANLAIVSESYFRLMRIALVAGRAFTSDDRDGAPGVCIVNEALAKRLFPGQSALGHVLLRGRDAELRAEIVGVIRDVKTSGLNAPAPDEIYYPMRQFGRPGMAVVARIDGDPASLQTAIRAAVTAVDKDQPISFFATLETNISQSLGAQRIVASLTVIFAGLALVLSAVGLYSVLSYAVSQRRAEIGIRMALGARPGQVVRLVMRGGLQLVVVGLTLGLAGATGAARLIRTLLFNVQPLDPLVYGGVAALFTVVATLACLLPSLRASRIDPLLALRSD
ncbi:MAG TPA: ABC transporter permease [Vicinamibacterales bacterium]|jgi:predicted permease|nr:ABC transporter permease [Vicinamibacterales bacterium]